MSITGPIVNYFYSPVVRPAVERPLSLLANFVREQFRINGGGVLFDTAFNITRSSSKYVFGTGAQTGQLVEVPAGQPAYQHDPVTGAPLGLSVEGSATNLLTYSSQFDNASWDSKMDNVTPNIEQAPDGSLTADKIFNNVGSTDFYVESLTLNPNTDYVFSIYLKSAGFNSGNIRLFTSETGFSIQSVDLSSGVGAYEALPNGWYRYKVSLTTSSTVSSAQLQFVRNSPTGDGVSGFFVWGAQLETGTKPTSYIPTVASTVTRAADIVTSDAATFGDWFNASEGTFVVEYESIADCVPLDINDGTTSNRIFIRQNTLSSFDVVSVSGGAQTTLSFSTTTTEGEMLRFELSYNGSNFIASFKGSTATQPASAPVGITNIKVGCNIVNTKHVNGAVKLLTFQPEATL